MQRDSKGAGGVDIVMDTHCGADLPPQRRQPDEQRPSLARRQILLAH